MSFSPRLVATFGALVLIPSVAGAGLAACSSDDASDPATDAGRDGSVGDGGAGKDGGNPPGDGSTAPPTPPDASGLSTACSTSADCHLVSEPSSCEETVCSCPTFVLDLDAAASWDTEVASYAAACRAAADGGLAACGVDCVDIQAVCCAGTCMAIAGNPGATCPTSGDAGADASDGN